ncbi:Serine/threonine protein kinase with TPR repeats (fragment) [Verrucomicrobia bacterium]
MNPKNPREESIFDGALQLPPEQRENYIKAASGEDPSLRQRVTELLRAHEGDGETLKVPAVERLQQITVVTWPPAGEKAGDKIGPYKLLQRIGEGGCGYVFMAEQEQPVRRRVALKVIKLGMDTKEVVGRFEVERQALAMMEHPNIAKVFDAGATESGRPYFVMELVRGIKITDYCDQNKVPMAERLRLFTQVCLAIQHAHQKGIIHRDIKPSNILVTMHDGVPVPKVIDFGIAKATHGRLTDKTVFTQFEQFIGTPAYMSPEQAEMTSLDIDTRSDIYSLGVLLYELLTSRTPFDPKELLASGLDAMRRAIREQEPPRPSTKLSTMLAGDLTTVAKQRHAAPPKLIHLVKGDLDWIVMKALEKDRTRRYDTAAGFASDIESFLSNQPVLARPPSSVYRFQKWVRRNKVAFAAASAVALSLLLGGAGFTWMYFREKQARHLADLEAVRSGQVAAFLEDMLKGVGPSVALGRDTKLLHEILDKTVERVSRDLKDQPGVQAELCNTIGEVYRAIGQPGRAEEMHRNAHELQSRGASGKSADAATSLNNLAMVLCDQWKLPEAESLHRQALELRRKIYGNTNASVAASLNNLAIVLRKEGKLAEAEGLHLEALALQKRLLPADHTDIAASLNNLGWVYRDEGKFGDAEDAFRQSLAMQKKLLGENRPGVAITMDNLAFVLCDQGKFDEAESLERHALELQRKFFGSDHPFVATGMKNLAMILGDRGELGQAEELSHQALTLRRQLHGEEHVEVANSLDGLALLLRKEKKLPDARPLAEQALAMRKSLLGDTHLDVSSSLNTLGLISHDEGKLPESERFYRDALSLQKNVVGVEHPFIATTLNNLGLTLRDEGKLDEAELDLRQALAMRQKLLSPQHPAIAASEKDLNSVLSLEGKEAVRTGQISKR